MGSFFTIMMILIVLVVVFFSVLIAFVIKKSKAPKTPEFIAEERKTMRQNVIQKRKKLASHTSQTYQQVTNAMVFELKNAVTYSSISGLIFDENRKPIVAFERVERGGNTNGQFIAITKKQEFVAEFTDSEATFYIDTELLGRVDSSGTIYNAHEISIGHAKHPTKADMDKKNVLLVLNNRQIATINCAPDYQKYGNNVTVTKVFDELGFAIPIISLTDLPTSEEENWLLAFAIFEIAFYGF